MQCVRYYTCVHISCAKHLKEPMEELGAREPQHREGGRGRNHRSRGAESDQEEANAGPHEADAHHRGGGEPVAERARDEGAAGVGEHERGVH